MSVLLVKAEIEMENASESMAVFRILMREKKAEVRLQVLSDTRVVYQYCIYPDGTDSLSITRSPRNMVLVRKWLHKITI
jgi:hypothetical protein